MKEEDILSAFKLEGEITPLNGGQNTSFRIKDCVLKPVGENTEFCEWTLRILSKMEPRGYRLSKPILSNEGTFVYRGWCCTHYEPGEEKCGYVKERLEISRRFHENIKNIDFHHMQKARNPWSVAQNIAWQREPLPEDISEEAYSILRKLLSGVTLKKSYEVQLIHSDLAGNIQIICGSHICWK